MFAYFRSIPSQRDQPVHIDPIGILPLSRIQGVQVELIPTLVDLNIPVPATCLEILSTRLGPILKE